MPDPVAVISSAAATVQLADVALRACRSAVTFVSDVKCARKDVNLLRAMLRDVESIARNLRNFIAEFSVSAGAGLEHTVLPDPITDAVAGLRHDIDNINGLLPGQNSGSLPQRVQFVFRGKNVAKALTLLERRKTALILALQILQRLVSVFAVFVPCVVHVIKASKDRSCSR
ncbi:hypothetical protein BDY21DRAFT_291581 [Lineolata rhizophorae]|uniref:Fungal N-terminal domain-containing protein n=1 Tax=Lineolata rhizophorae TaxID=578093 RepID=A0A6A6NRI8_9PEZI|nr:hypothetical protein BDY21DRAFT_291581 [Lineolata rhizophorae]